MSSFGQSRRSQFFFQGKNKRKEKYHFEGAQKTHIARHLKTLAEIPNFYIASSFNRNRRFHGRGHCFKYKGHFIKPKQPPPPNPTTPLYKIRWSFIL